MNVLVIDVGGSSVKILATGQKTVRKMASGRKFTASQMMAGVRVLARGWKYDVIALGLPSAVAHNQPIAEPPNLGNGWVDFDYAAAFGRPVRIINDAAMQALGAYKGGRMLFLGFGTGLGTTLIADGVIIAMELAHLPYKKATFEDYVGDAALKRDGKQKWRENVADVIVRLTAALLPDDIVLGGGNARHIKHLPPLGRRGDNADAFTGGFRLWDHRGLKHDKPRVRTARR